MKAQFTIGIFGVIFDEQMRVLLCHRRDHDLWNLPGGGLEKGESPVDCLLREVREETGLDVEVSKLVGIYNKPDKDEIVLSFVCKPVGGIITLNDEADRIEYFEVDNLPANISTKQVERINDAVSCFGEPVFKTQTGTSSIELAKEGWG